jgi:hypothetical protein
LKKQFVLTLIIVMALLMGVLPVGAQSDFTPEEQELIALVSDAYENLLAQKSFHATMEQTSDQSVEVQGMAIDQNIVLSTNIDVLTDGTGGIQGMSTVIDQEMAMSGAQAMEVAMTIEMIFLDGTTYMRFGNLPPEMAGFLPEAWFDMSDPSAGATAGLDFSTLAGATGQAEALSLYPVSEETIDTITELESTEIDGQSVRVIEFTLNTGALLDNPVFGTTLSALGTTDQEDLIAQYMEAVSFVQRVYITDDGTLLQNDMDINIDGLTLEQGGQSVTTSQVSNAVVTYGAFGEPIEITAPTLGE